MTSAVTGESVLMTESTKEACTHGYKIKMLNIYVGSSNLL